MSVRLVPVDDPAGDLQHDRQGDDRDPRDPALYRRGLSSARAQLREARARQHARVDDARADGSGPGSAGRATAGDHGGRADA